MRVSPGGGTQAARGPEAAGIEAEKAGGEVCAKSEGLYGGSEEGERRRKVGGEKKRKKAVVWKDKRQNESCEEHEEEGREGRRGVESKISGVRWKIDVAQLSIGAKRA